MGGKRARVTARDIAKADSLPALIEQLVKRITDGNTEVKEASVQALKSIATQNHGENTGLLYKSGAVKPLVELLKHGSSDAQYNACGALAAIAEGKPDVQNAIVDGGGVPPIVSLLRMGGAAVQEQVHTARLAYHHFPPRKLAARALPYAPPLLCCAAWNSGPSPRAPSRFFPRYAPHLPASSRSGGRGIGGALTRHGAPKVRHQIRLHPASGSDDF